MRAMTEAGLALLDLAKPDQAVAFLEKALAISERTQVPAAPDRRDIMTGLARARAAADARRLSGS